MAGTFLGKYDTTSANNTATGTNSVSVAEGMLPSNINNAFRSVMADIRQHYNEAEWIEYGDGAGTYTATYASATSFTIDGANVTAIYHAGRRVKAVASTPGTIYGTISSTSFSTNTTVNVTWDSGNLSSEAITSIHIGVLAKTNNSIPTGVIATANIADGAVTLAKLGADSVNGTKIADDAIDSEHYTNGSIDTAHIAADQIVGSLIADNAIDSEHYTDGSIDTAHIAADQITNAKIADDQIDSEHYVNGSIDTAHIADSQITSAKIADGAILNADINASAAIAATKIHDGTISNTEFGHLNGVTSNIQTQLDAREAANANITAIGALAKTDGNIIVGNGSTWVAENGGTARTSLGIGTIATQAANSVSISGGSITGLGAPSSGSDAATKTYVDGLVTGLKTRIICRAATTANITTATDLQAGDSLDGITLAEGNRVLVKNQSTASQNGIYTVAASGANAGRDTEFDAIGELAGQMVIVQEGSANADKFFLCTTDSSASLGSDSITFTVVQPSNVGDVTLTGTQTLTNKTLTSPVISDIVSISNGDINLTPNGTGHVTVKGNTNPGSIQFNCEANTHGQILKAQEHSVGTSATIVLPAAAGTLVGTGDTGTLPLAAMDIDGGTDIGADLTTSDLIVVDDGAGGTNRKAALSRVVTLMSAQGFVTDDPTALAIALG
jgi:hypothetical protein